MNVVRLVEALPKAQSSDIVGKQLMRSAISVGANYRAACKARSKSDFISKIGIAEEEADETQYWLEILFALDRIGIDHSKALHAEAQELTAILTSSGKTARANR